jgi:hypothetical protein
MPVRYEDDDTVLPTGRPAAPAAPASSDEDGSAPGRLSGVLGGRRPPRWLMGAIPVVALLLVTAFGVIQRQSRNEPPSTTSAPGTTAGAPGNQLPRGDAVFGAGGTRDLHGVPVGYPQTRVGGIQAALNYAAGTGGLPVWNSLTRKPINDYIYTDSVRGGAAISDDIVRKVQAQYQFDDFGRPLNPDGTVNPNMRLYAAYLGKYGAYRVANVAPDSERPTSITVEIWGPNVFGVGSRDDLTRVQVTWSTTILTVTWVNGDWRISDSRYPSARPPAPANPRRVNVPFEERARLLGAGWLVPANASEDPDPTLELAKL